MTGKKSFKSLFIYSENNVFTVNNKYRELIIFNLNMANKQTEQGSKFVSAISLVWEHKAM